MSEKQFLNPYNFISLPKQKAKAYEDTDRHTGVIEYSITTRSPLFIPNHSASKMLEEESKKSKKLDFFSYNDLQGKGLKSDEYYSPVIPGSELRGMLRSIYETLTDSCMGILNEDTYPTLRVSQAFEAGLIMRTNTNQRKYQLVPAEDYIYRKKDENGKYIKMYDKVPWKEGTLLYFDREIQNDNPNVRKGKPEAKNISVDKGTRKMSGYLIKGMKGGCGINEKHNCHIFVKKISGDMLDLKDADIDRLKAVLEAYQNEPGAENAYKEYSKELDAFLKGEGNECFPVYKSVIQANGQTFIYLAPACFTKEVSMNSLKDLAGNFVPCKERQVKCPTCDLFGMTGKNNEEAEASKIRFADATPEETSDVKNYYDKEVTLEALGSPRLNNVEFYLKRPKGADFWTYDYYVKDGKIYPYKATLRGRKYYWHQTDRVLPEVEAPGIFNMTIRPVKKNITFNGKVYFDGISYKQLNQLLWILNGGNASEQPATGPIAYKLGAGKPLGLGSVELKVTGCKERIVRMTEEEIVYEVKEEHPIIPLYENSQFSAEVKEDFFVISSLNATEGKFVSYPRVTGQEEGAMTEGFKWFVENHVGYDYIKNRIVKMPNSRTQMKRGYALPGIQGVEMLPMLKSSSAERSDKVRDNRNGKRSVGENSNRQSKTICCKINSSRIEDRNGRGFFYYNDQGGKVFEDKEILKKGTKIEIQVTNDRDGKISGRFIRVVNDVK